MSPTTSFLKQNYCINWLKFNLISIMCSILCLIAPVSGSILLWSGMWVIWPRVPRKIVRRRLIITCLLNTQKSRIFHDQIFHHHLLFERCQSRLSCNHNLSIDVMKRVKIFLYINTIIVKSPILINENAHSFLIMSSFS